MNFLIFVYQAPEFMVYNSTFENEWCEVVVSTSNRNQPKDKFHLGDDGSSRPYDNIIDAENDDWRTQTGLSFRSQGWGQQSGKTNIITWVKKT